MLLIAVLIQPLTQQPRYYLLTTIRQPLRYISWFVPTARSRLTCGPSRPPMPKSPLMAGPSQQAPHQYRHRPRDHLVTALPQRRHLCPSSRHALLLLPQGGLLMSRARLDADDAASLRRELAWLRKRGGFTAARLVRAPIVDEVLRGSLEDSFERLRHRFVSAIHSLSESGSEQDEPLVGVLLAAFALSPETAGSGSLLERRRAMASRLGCSMETIASREEAGLRLLHSRLVAGRYAQAPLVLDVPEMHGGLVYEETTTLIVVEQRRWRGTVEHYRLANMAGELDFVTISRSYPAHVTAQPGGEFSVNSRPVEGAGWNDHFWHIDPATGRRTPMQDATRYDLAFRAEPVPGEEPTTPISLASRAFHARSLLATIQVRFVGEVPASIWQFTGASPFARPQAANQYNRTSLDAQQRVTLTQRDVHGGLFGGFGWEW